jgi:hypothetical protein
MKSENLDTMNDVFFFLANEMILMAQLKLTSFRDGLELDEVPDGSQQRKARQQCVINRYTFSFYTL